MTTDSDPRPLLHDSLDQASKIIAGVTPEQLHLATPCSEFDVSELLAHLVGVAYRIASIARLEPQGDLTEITDVRDDGWANAYHAPHIEAIAAWDDAALLDTEIELPWGKFPGRSVVDMYALETTVHAWDLAAATGQVAALDPLLAEACLPIAGEMLPPEYRGGDIPFGPVIAVPGDSPAYARLAAYLGRSA
jgi:uncharacterized protein (TIGR03086 family)